MKFTAGRYLLLIAAGLLIWAAVGGLSLFLGSVNVWQYHDLQPETFNRIIMARLDRALVASIVGAALAVSGAVLQALLRNPLAEPYILGVSGGASLGVILGTILLPFAWVVSLGGRALAVRPGGLGGFLLAGLTIVVVYLIAQRRGRLDPYRLILTGVIANAFFSAAIMLTAALAGDKLRNEIIYWLMGGLGSTYQRWDEIAVAGGLTLVGVGIFIYQAKGFNLMAFGEDVAASLGLAVEPHRRLALVVAAVLTATSVSLAGPIGFVGLIVPHILRLLFGSDYRLLVPLTVFGGATFLLVADKIVQVIPYRVTSELPVGVVTALCGVPFFILLMRRKTVTMGGEP